jgi:hypothetical protein
MSLKRGDVWLADLNPTQGSEQVGIRPIRLFLRFNGLSIKKISDNLIQ